ncbi:MAG: hypothetical protein JRN15_05600 [Nitrososphaerota archaeon]|nr:hypothetical protein [Nitrososphaerota archaeon]
MSDLRCACCGGEISWAALDVLQSAPKEQVIIFTCLDCKCGYDTSASRTHWCDNFNRRDFRFQARQSGNSIENEGKLAYKQVRKVRESNRPMKRPSLINQPTKPEDRFKFARETEGRSLCNLFFEFLFGR